MAERWRPAAHPNGPTAILQLRAIRRTSPGCTRHRESVYHCVDLGEEYHELAQRTSGTEDRLIDLGLARRKIGRVTAK